jgi:RNA polymerase sigma-70 factor (ECF subfamily)
MVSHASSSDTIEALWRELAQPLRGYLRRRTRSAADADDLLQTVFVRAQRQLPTLRDAGRLQGWIYRIARNAVIDYYRTRRETLPLKAEIESTDPDGRDAVDLTPSLRRFIAALPELYREPLIRHEFQAQPIAAVAAALGITETAAKSRVRRARLLLREMLDRCCRFEFDRRGRVIDAVPREVLSGPGECRCGPGQERTGGTRVRRRRG